MWVSESGSAVAGSGLTEDITAALVISHGNTRNGCKTHVAEKGVAMFSFGG